MVEYLEEHKLLLRQGTIVDATIIAAPPSTKRRAQTRPEMCATWKGKSWHYGRKAHIRVDAKRGLVHTVVVTTASEADINIMDELLHGGSMATKGMRASRAGRHCVKNESAGVCWPRLRVDGR